MQKGVARGEVFVKDFPQTSPRPPQEWESEERYLGIEKTVEHGEVLGKCREVLRKDFPAGKPSVDRHYRP